MISKGLIVFIIVAFSLGGFMHEMYHAVTLGVREPARICFVGYLGSEDGLLYSGTGWTYANIPPDNPNLVIVNEIGAYSMSILGVIGAIYLTRKNGDGD